MALEEYKRKRRFNETPESRRKVGMRSGHRLVVQRHHASHLHYDFRLEMEGVLKSWAVPKGPSLDPADKRLAMQVEDHPVSYFHFEGIIPPGNYGAGTVMVWDTGTWEPVGDSTAMLKKGDLKFRLKGEKLQGEFALVHIKSRRPGSKGNEWLLIKHRDEHVVPGFDIDKLDHSVLTQRSLAEIAGDERSAEWLSSRKTAPSKRRGQDWLADSIAKADKAARAGKKPTTIAKTATKTRAASATSAIKSKTKTSTSSRSKKKSELASVQGAVKTTMPHVIHPMLATLVDGAFDDEKWLFEIKWDGYRSVAFFNENGDKSVRLVSRNQNEQTQDFPELQIIGKSLKCETAILDGEIVALNEQGRASFSLMQ